MLLLKKGVGFLIKYRKKRKGKYKEYKVNKED